MHVYIKYTYFETDILFQEFTIWDNLFLPVRVHTWYSNTQAAKMKAKRNLENPFIKVSYNLFSLSKEHCCKVVSALTWHSACLRHEPGVRLNLLLRDLILLDTTKRLHFLRL